MFERFDIVLDMVTTAETVSVTATPGGLTDREGIQPVNVITAEDVILRAKTVVAQAVEGEVGLHLQRTSPGMAGIVVRGLTGNKVNVFVDGVRYSNGAQRGGVNTFLDLIDPSIIDSIEVLRGTSSAQYGSDVLGCSLQFLTHVPRLATGQAPRIGGTVSLGGETAHRGGFSTGTFNYARAGFGELSFAACDQRSRSTSRDREDDEYQDGGDTRVKPAIHCCGMWGRPSGLLARADCRAEALPHMSDAATTQESGVGPEGVH